MAFDLSIIIVNWNGGRLLTRCIETVVSSNPKVTYEIVIVDNASTDDSLDQLRASDVIAALFDREQIRIIRNTDNRAFGAANNKAFAVVNSPYWRDVERFVVADSGLRWRWGDVGEMRNLAGAIVLS